MLSVTSPLASATVSSASFTVSGTCSDAHEVTVKLVTPGSGQFHDYYATPTLGNWSVTVYPWGAGAYKVKVICSGMTDPIAVDVTAEAPPNPTSPIVSPPPPGGGGTVTTGS